MQHTTVKKHTGPAPGLVYMSPHTFLPCIGRGQLSGISGKLVIGSTVAKVASVAGKGVGRARKKFRVGIGEVSGLPTVRFSDDLTAGLVEDWNREVERARASLG